MSRKKKVTGVALIIIICASVVLTPFLYLRSELIDRSASNENQHLVLFNRRKPKIYRTSNINIDYLLRTAPMYHAMNIPTNSSCREKRPRFSRRKLPMTALVSFQGSGSIWVRHLVQQMTGIATGSIECRSELRKSKAFYLGECEISDRVILVNTNREYIRGKFEEKFEKLIVLKRNAFDTLRSAFTMKNPGHSESVDSEIYNVRGWWEFIRDEAVEYEDYYSFWMDPTTVPTFLLYYEDLQNKLRETLKNLARFLNWRIRDEDLNCAISMSEGYFHRIHVHNLTNKDVFAGKLWTEVENADVGISEVVDDRRKKGNLTESGDILKKVLEKAKEEFYDDSTL